MSRAKWMIGCCVLATLGFTGCSSDDVKDVLGIDPEGDIAEAAVEGVLNDVVDPAITALDLLIELLSAPPAPALSAGGGGLVCPDTGAWCDSGTASCVAGGSALEFTFSSCTLSDGTETATLSGGLNFTPPSPLTLVNLVVNEGLGLNGTVAFSGLCDTTWNINATDGTVVSATLVQCESDVNPQPTSLLVITAQVSGVGTVQMTFTFNGTSVAAVSVTVGGAPYATCDVNLDTFDASCDGV